MSVPEEDIDGHTKAGASKLADRVASLVAYILLGGMLVLLVRPADVTSYNIGQSAGVALISILVSYGIWALIRRSRGSGERWSPWILMIALFVATLFKAMPQEETPPPDAAASASVANLTSEDVFGELPGMRYEPFPADALEQAEEDLFANPAAAGAFLSMDGRLVFEGRKQVGLITVLFTTPEAAGSAEFQTGFLNGFRDSAEEQGGGPITAHSLDGADAQGGPTAQGYALAFAWENASITVLGGDRATAELIANGLLASL